MPPGGEEVTKHSVHTLVFRSQKRAHEMFISDQGNLPEIDKDMDAFIKRIKAKAYYGANLVSSVEREKQRKLAYENRPDTLINSESAENAANSSEMTSSDPSSTMQSNAGANNANQLVAFTGTQLQKRKMMDMSMPKPNWHAPWKLYRVISGHTGWVRSVAVEPGNMWFCTGAADRVIKIWDLASGKLKLSLTGHVSTVRGLVVSPRQPYLFSCGEDRQVKCWDLEYNKVIRHYHGHLSAVYDLALHPTIDVLVSCGRDSTARVWDMRTKVNIHTLTGHTSTVGSVVCQATDPQIITGN